MSCINQYLIKNDSDDETVYSYEEDTEIDEEEEYEEIEYEDPN